MEATKHLVTEVGGDHPATATGLDYECFAFTAGVDHMIGVGHDFSCIGKEPPYNQF